MKDHPDLLWDRDRSPLGDLAERGKLRREAVAASLPKAARAAAPAPQALDLKSGLTPFSGTIDDRMARHIANRVLTGNSEELQEALVGKSAPAMIDFLVTQATEREGPEPNEWAEEGVPLEILFAPADSPERRAYVDQTIQWTVELLYQSVFQRLVGGLRERMTWFWHNHFVVSAQSYFIAQFSHSYVYSLREFALGNFRDFVAAAGKEPAMLIYLDGTNNHKLGPNENYARELLELFTMGPLGPDGSPNYSEDDIREIARALTGWQANFLEIGHSFNSARFDTGIKSFFGRSGSFGYDEVHDILFEERPNEIAHFVCRKLYREFIYEVPDEDFVAELATVFVESDFSIEAAVRALLKSERFFDSEIMGARIKNPMDFVSGLIHQTGIAIDFPLLVGVTQASADLGYAPLDPPDVSGWDGGQAWLDTASYTIRIQDAERFVNLEELDALPMAHGLHDPQDLEFPFHLAIKLAEHLLQVPLELLIEDESAVPFDGDLETNPIPAFIAEGPEIYRVLSQRLLSGHPWYDWGDVDEQAYIKRYMLYLMTRPEYQLA